MDRRLSVNGTMSCGMCHVPEQGFTVNDLATAVGLEGRSLRRNAPTVLNAAFQRSLFHDGRSATLEEQVWGPLLAREEMGNQTRKRVEARVSALPDYRAAFARTFADHRVSADNITRALAAYQRSLVSGGSAFDRWHFGGETTALDPLERAGFDLFTGRGGCVACHRIETVSALFTDHAFHNTGISHAHAVRARDGYRVELAPGVETRISSAAIEAAFGANSQDHGREEVTALASDRNRFKTPSLRNVALTAPYMHDGSLASLEAVVDYYDHGGSNAPDQDPRIRPLGLSQDERAAIVAFLRTLTGSNIRKLAADARANACTPTFRPDGSN